MKKYLSICFLMFTASPVLAAQYGKIVVDSATVFEFPQGNSKMVTKVLKDEVMVVSNLPTENFYKVRTSKGEVGWVSGNDMFVTKDMAAIGVQPESENEKTENKNAEEKNDSEKKESTRIVDTTPSEPPEYSRVIFAGGISTLSYSGAPAVLKAGSLNNSWNGLAEFQFRLSKLIFWAIRTEVFTASSGKLNLGSGTTQSLSQLIIPVQVGLQFSPVTLKKFRLGMGAYVGFAPYSVMNVNQETTTNTYDLSYSSIDPCASASIQMKIGLSASSGIFLEGAYRYQQTATFEAKTSMGGVSAFKADYSGIAMRLGLEFRI